MKNNQIEAIEHNLKAPFFIDFNGTQSQTKSNFQTTNLYALFDNLTMKLTDKYVIL
jgi:hypothetical protein